MTDDPLPTVSVEELELRVQAWLGDVPFNPHRVEQVAWPILPTEKPDEGFFTSSWDGQTSAWIEYHATTSRKTESRSTYLLIPDPAAILYVIDSPDDYVRLVEEYPHRYPNPANPRVCPHWTRLASEGPFDAIHMTADAVADHNLWHVNGWEVESTLWLRPKLTVLDA